MNTVKAVAAAAILVTLLACGTPTPTYDVGKTDTFEQDITLQDGRTVHCLFWLDQNRSSHTGMSCDWANIRSETD